MISCLLIRNIISSGTYKAWKALRFFAMNANRNFNMATGNLHLKGGNLHLAGKCSLQKHRNYYNRQSVKQIYSFSPANEDKSWPVLFLRSRNVV